MNSVKVPSSLATLDTSLAANLSSRQLMNVSRAMMAASVGFFFRPARSLVV